MISQDLPLLGLKLLKPLVHRDERGFFFESYKKPLFDSLGIKGEFVQDNHSFSKKGTLRGMHFQSKPGQAKLIRVVEGIIFDVLVDIRTDSPTFGKWYGLELSGESHEMLYVPIGFAHGFMVVSENAHVMYKTSSIYNGETEKGFRYDDPDVGIKWPLDTPLLSPRDSSNPFFREVFPE